MWSYASIDTGKVWWGHILSQSLVYITNSGNYVYKYCIVEEVEELQRSAKDWVGDRDTII